MHYFHNMHQFYHLPISQKKIIPLIFQIRYNDNLLFILDFNLYLKKKVCLNFS